MLLISERAVAQDGLSDVDKLMDASTGAIIKRPKDKQTPFITDKTLNHFAAKRQAYYLSGTANLSLYENFAIANVSDGTLQVGRNYSPSKKDDLVNCLITVAVQSNIANNVANLLSSNKLANDVGLPLSLTYFFVNATSVGLGKDFERHKAELERKRAFQYALLKRNMGHEYALIDGAAPDADTKKEANEAVTKKATETFFAAELASFEKQQPAFHTAWVRLQGFVPVTSSTYQVAPSGSLDFVKQNTRKWSAGFSGGAVWEKFGGGSSIFLNGSVSAVRTNAVEQKTDDIQAYAQYGLPPTPAPAGQLYTSGDGDKVYVGDLGEAWTYPLKAQAIYLLPSSGDSKIGLDMQLERYAGSYAKTNVLIGIPVFLKGSGETGVNVEAQVKFRDVSKRINGSDRATVGLSVALPFGSIVK